MTPITAVAPVSLVEQGHAIEMLINRPRRKAEKLISVDLERYTTQGRHANVSAACQPRANSQAPIASFVVRQLTR